MNTNDLRESKADNVVQGRVDGPAIMGCGKCLLQKGLDWLAVRDDFRTWVMENAA